MSQGELFVAAVADPPAARHRKTSVEAAQQVRPRVNSYKARVLEALERGPKTDQEIAIDLSLPENTVRPRRIELEREGHVEDTGTTRRTTANRRAIVWRAKAK